VPGSTHGSTRFPPALIFGAILFIAIAGVAVVLLGYDPDAAGAGGGPDVEVELKRQAD
jgi:hypothetical protein